MVGGLIGCTRESIHEEYLPIIRENCKYHNKTEDEFWQEVAESTADFEAYMTRNEGENADEHHD